MPGYTNIAKPTGASYTNVAKPTGSGSGTIVAGMSIGLLIPLTISIAQSVGVGGYTNVNKPVGSSYTNILKPV
mgnify:FL=1